MMEFVEYLWKSSICIVLIYGFYRLFFQQEKTLVFNRIYLVAGLLACLLLPALDITVYLPAIFANEVAETVAVQNTDEEHMSNLVALPSHMAVTTPAVKQTINWYSILLTSYLAISVLFLLFFLTNITRLIFRIIDAETIREDRTVYVLMDLEIMPYSFLNHIFISRKGFETGTIKSEIIRHEKVHGQQWHTMDILFVELVKTLFWFHPGVWLYKRSIQLNHEYLADNRVLLDCEVKSYQRTLVDYTQKNHQLGLVSNFNYSFTKKRLIMMTRMKTNKWRFGSKIALLFPILMVAFLVSATCQTKEEPPTEEEKAAMEAEMESARKEMEAAQVELEAARKEMEAAKKVIKEKKILLGENHEELELELEKMLDNLEIDLEGLDINLEDLKMNIKKGITIDLKEELEGGTKRLVIKSGGEQDLENEFEFEFDIDVEFDDEDIEKLIELKHGDHENIMFIGDDGEVIDIKGHDGEYNIKVIEKHGDHEMIWISEDEEGHEGSTYRINIETGGDDDDELIHIIKKEIHKAHGDHGDHHIEIIHGDDGKKVEKRVIVIKDGEKMEWTSDDDRKEIEVIVITEDDGKKKKKKNKK